MGSPPFFNSFDLMSRRVPARTPQRFPPVLHFYQPASASPHRISARPDGSQPEVCSGQQCSIRLKFPNFLHFFASRFLMYTSSGVALFLLCAGFSSLCITALAFAKRQHPVAASITPRLIYRLRSVVTVGQVLWGVIDWCQ